MLCLCVCVPARIEPGLGSWYAESVRLRRMRHLQRVVTSPTPQSLTPPLLLGRKLPVALVVTGGGEKKGGFLPPTPLSLSLPLFKSSTLPISRLLFPVYSLLVWSSQYLFFMFLFPLPQSTHAVNVELYIPKPFPESLLTSGTSGVVYTLYVSDGPFLFPHRGSFLLFPHL